MAEGPTAYAAMMELACEEIDRRDIIGRIWRRDHTVWKPRPDEIADRLGWLDVSVAMRSELPSLRRFADEVRADGFRRVLLLGMGGSSLGPEALSRTFGSADGYPQLRVLDSVLPSEVRAATDAIDPERTLFLVSSKSGATVETNALYRHFRREVEASVGAAAAGQHFVAITDPDTPLATLGEREGFRRVFANPPDIGGRYSVQSLFGLVPAALLGLDLDVALDRIDAMARRCSRGRAARDNPAARVSARPSQPTRPEGRYRLTMLTSPSVASFAPWAEQLVAESLGKEGKGIVPVVDEPITTSARLSGDRLLVYLRLQGDDNAATDAVADSAVRDRRPLMTLKLGEKSELWGEFYRWEFATAVAGALLEVNPFDQPDVELSKRMAISVLDGTGGTDDAPSGVSPAELLADAQPGGYLAVLVFVRRTVELDSALAELRRTVGEVHGVATTVGYGPRYMHSTGQLHKGGPANGRFLQLLEKPRAGRAGDVVVPGAGYTFGRLARAQADGDLGALASLGRPVSRVYVEGTGAEDGGRGAAWRWGLDCLRRHAGGAA